MFSRFDNILHFLRIFALGPFADQVELTPPYFYFSCSDPLTQQ